MFTLISGHKSSLVASGCGSSSSSSNNLPLVAIPPTLLSANLTHRKRFFIDAVVLGRSLVRVFGVLLFLLLLVVGCGQAAERASFAGLDNAAHIYGPRITSKDLKGKVVFLEYWGINCPPCRSSFPHLIEKQKEFEKTGKFTILASHVQGMEPAVRKFCEEKRGNFPVVQGFREKAAPGEGFIPYAVLIDHTGKVVAAGSPTDLYKKIPELIAAAPTPIPPILGEVRAKFFRRQAKKLGAGKPLAPILKLLDEQAAKKTDRSEEAASIVAAVRTFVKNEWARLEKQKETRPARTYLELIPFKKRVRGLAEEELAVELLKEIKSDKSTMTLVKIMKDGRKLMAKINKKGSTEKTKKKRMKIKKALKALLKNQNTPEVIISEGREYLELTL